MKTTTKILIALFPALMLSASIAHAQCAPGFTWSQSSNNVIDFTNTSVPNTQNSTMFYWNFGDNQSSNSQNPTHTYANPGVYMVCVTMADSISLCQATFCDSIFVYGNVFCTATASASSLTAATCPACADGSAYASMSGGTAPYTYSWSDGETTQVASALAPGTYTVCITDANGCVACASVTVYAQNSNCNASFTWSQSSNNVIDFVNTSNNVVNNNAVYVWNYGDGNYGYSANATNMQHTYQNAGTYWVCLDFVDSLSGCSASYCDSVTVSGNVLNTPCNAAFVLIMDSLNTNQAWVFNQSTGGPNMQYIWSWGDNTYDSIPYPSHVYTSTGSYNLCLIVYDPTTQCVDSMCQVLMVPRLTQQAASAPFYVNVQPMGIHEQQQTNWSLFPNPASTELTIKTDCSMQGKKYQILDIAGRTIISSTLEGTNINVSTLDNGMYILQIENNKGGFSAQRFMKD